MCVCASMRVHLPRIMDDRYTALVYTSSPSVCTTGVRSLALSAAHTHTYARSHDGQANRLQCIDFLQRKLPAFNRPLQPFPVAQSQLHCLQPLGQYFRTSSPAPTDAFLFVSRRHPFMACTELHCTVHQLPISTPRPAPCLADLPASRRFLNI